MAGRNLQHQTLSGPFELRRASGVVPVVLATTAVLALISQRNTLCMTLLYAASVGLWHQALRKIFQNLCPHTGQTGYALTHSCLQLSLWQAGGIRHVLQFFLCCISLIPDQLGQFLQTSRRHILSLVLPDVLIAHSGNFCCFCWCQLSLCLMAACLGIALSWLTRFCMFHLVRTGIPGHRHTQEFSCLAYETVWFVACPVQQIPCHPFQVALQQYQAHHQASDGTQSISE